MAKNNDLNIKLTTSLTSGLKSLKNVNKSLTDMQRNVNKNSGSMNNMQKNITKMNAKLTNLGKDANRASTGFKGLGKSMNTLNSVMNIGKWYLLANAIKNVVNASMDNIEVVNMFSVALGQLTEKAEETVQALSKVYGLDATNIRSAIGNYSTLARSMGMTNVQAEAMATSTYQLALELSSLYNIPINQVLGDLKSGLVGQSETVYKYGLDVTEAGIKAEAMAQGITKSVRSMSQGEKMALRYNVMLQKSGLSHGDFARTIDQPANQLRILQERFTTLSRSIGNMFIPMLTAILPYANALLKVVIEIVDRLALLLGFEPLKVQNMDTGFGGVAEDIDDQGDALDSATKKAKAYENQLMGFDQLNILKEPKDTSSSGGDDTGSILGGMEIPRYDVELVGSEKVEGIADRLRETFKKWKEDTYYLTDSLKALGLFGLQPLIEFTSGTFGDFYETVLKPFGEWTLSKDGLPKLIYILANDMSKMNLEPLQSALSKLYEAVVIFADANLDNLINLYEKFLKPVGKFIVSEKGIPRLVEIIADLIKDINWDKINVALGDFYSVMAKIVEYTIGGTIDLIDKVLAPLLKLVVGFVFPEALTMLTDWLETLHKIVTKESKNDGEFSLMDTVDKFLTWYDNLGDGMKFSDTFDGMLGEVESFSDDLDTQLSSLFTGDTDGLLENMKGRINKLKEAFEKEMQNGKETNDKLFLPIQAKLITKWEDLKLSWDNLVVNVKDKVATFSAFVGTKVEDFKLKWSEVTKSAKNVTRSFKARTDTLPKTIKDKWNELSAQFKNKGVKFSAKVTTLVSTIKNKWNEFSLAFKDKAVEFSVKLKTSLGDIRAFVRQLVEAVNDNLIAKLDFDIDLGLLGKHSWKAPRIPVPFLAKGGVVNDPTLAMVGEAGKEVVMPLENNTGWIRDLAGQISEHGGSGSNMNEDTMYRVMSKAIKDNMGDVILYLDSKEVARANRKGEAKLGRNFNRIQTT